MIANNCRRAGLTAVLALAAGSLAASPSPVGDSSVRAPLTITSGQGDARAIPFFPAAGNAHGWQGFMRVSNHSNVGGDVVIRAIDDAGRDFGTVTLALDAKETTHLNSSDLEDGNATKGLAGRIGAPGEGDWRLELSSDLRIEALAYIRTADGFVTPMHDVAPAAQPGRNLYRIVTFNPGSNYRQESLLRLVNPGNTEARVSVRAVDDRRRSAGPVRLRIPAKASHTVSALALEEGAAGLDGTLGDGTGKWRLDVESTVPLLAMSLLSTPTGHVTNLSTAPAISTFGAQPPPGDGTDRSPSFAGTGPSDQTYTEGAAITALTLPAASGGDGALTYALTPAVPGLQFDARARRLSGTPTSAGTYNMTYAVTDADGDSDSRQFTITVSKPPTRRDGDCYVGLLVNPGESCTYPGTNDVFSVTADGRGRFLFFTSGGAININSGNISFAASHQGGGVWRIDRVGG